MFKRVKITGLCVCVSILGILTSCNSEVQEKNVKKTVQEKNLIKLENRTWYAQKETNNYYTGNLSVIFREDGTFNIYDREQDKNCMNGNFEMIDSNKMKLVSNTKEFNPPSLWSCKNEDTFEYKFLDKGELQLSYNDVDCIFTTDKEQTEEVVEEKLSSASMANKGLAGSIQDMLKNKVYYCKAEKKVVRFKGNKMEVYTIKDVNKIFKENNEINGKLQYKGNANIIEEKNEIHYALNKKEYVVSYEIYKEDMSEIVLKYEKTEYKMEEVCVPLG